MKYGFDNNKYLKMQSEHIRDRIAMFGDKLYLNSEASFLTTTTPPGFFPVLNRTVNLKCFTS